MMSFPSSLATRTAARSIAVAAMAVAALAGCAAPYGTDFGNGYGTGYQPQAAYPTGYQNGYPAGYQTGYSNAGYGNTGYANTGYGNTGYGAPYGTSGTQISGAPGYAPPAQYPAYPQQPGYDQYGYPRQAQGGNDNSYGGNASGYGDPYAVRYGWVESIEQVGGQPADTSGAGAVIGGVVGGLLGHQVGGGRGNTVATIGGAVAGALAGNEVEKRSGTTAPAFRVRVRTNDNGSLTLTQASPYNLRTGDRVRIQNGVAMPY